MVGFGSQEVPRPRLFDAAVDRHVDARAMARRVKGGTVVNDREDFYAHATQIAGDRKGVRFATENEDGTKPARIAAGWCGGIDVRGLRLCSRKRFSQHGCHST